MRSMRRALAGVAAFVAACAALTACTGPAEKTIEYTQSAVTVHVGETLVVHMGEINSSVGTDWVITTKPDSAVLGEGESEYVSDDPDPAPGSSSDLSYRFEATGAGTTVVAFEYQFRGAVPDDPDEQKSAEITVTVK